jgi:hypothetical protein
MKNKKMPKYAFIKALLNSVFVATVMTSAGLIFALDTIESYLTFAFVATLFIMTNELSKHIWEQEKYILAILNSFYTLFAYLGMATIIFYI